MILWIALHESDNKNICIGDTMKKNTFSGFTHDTLRFLNELNLNNNKIWFEQNKERYKSVVVTPFIKLGESLIETMNKIDPELELRPDKIISRIYRDVRFSQDKSPYRSNVWISYKRPLKEWAEAPVFFFELTPDSYRYGMGFYSAGKSTMDLFRIEMNRRTDEFLKIASAIARDKIFTVEGETYKRKIENKLPEKLQEWYQKKNLYLMTEHDIGKELFNGDIAATLESDFKSLEKLYKFLWSIKV
jgi:uncharacterized protein (TIGR02453 family)